MMTQIWSTEVNKEDVVFDLKNALRTALGEYHKDILQYIRDNSVRKDSTAMGAVLKKFFLMLVDTSINEKSVHFISSTDVEFDKFYNAFESILIKDCGSFIKTALEIGYKEKRLKVVYSIFDEYSNTVKSFLPHKTQKKFEKTKSEVVIKFIRFILSTRLKQFATFDVQKLDARWSPGCESAMKHVFDDSDSVFLNDFYKGVDQKKFDRLNFQKYWLIMTGKDSVVMRRMYDSTLMTYHRLLKAYSAKDTKIRAHKLKQGIELPSSAEEMVFMSLLTPIPQKYVEDKVKQLQVKPFKIGDLQESKECEEPEVKLQLTKSYSKQEEGKTEDTSGIAEDGDTLDDSESTSEPRVDSSQIFKAKQLCWEERTRSMKKNNERVSFCSSSNERRSSM